MNEPGCDEKEETGRTDETYSGTTRVDFGLMKAGEEGRYHELQCSNQKEEQENQNGWKSNGSISKWRRQVNTKDASCASS